MLAFKIVHRRGADRTPHCLALIKHRKINDHPIEVVAQYFTSLQGHCKSSVLQGNAPHPPALLRARTNRPSDGRAAEQRYELAAIQSITWSAATSRPGGTVRPSAFAVL